jgi:phage-related protein
MPANGRHLSRIGTGVWELRDQNKDTRYRVAYLPRKNNVVYVLHAFTKQSAQMTQSDKQTVLKRFKEVKRELTENKE